VLSVAFSPDGAALASAGTDEVLIVWNMQIQAWQARACGQAGRNLTPAEWRLYLNDETYHKTCPQWPEES
jgi:hypothetical protein